ncbi:MAG: metallopeptidase family protein [Actinomycetota bacterium]
MGFSLGSQQFEALVDQAMEELPEELFSRISNLEIVIEDVPGPQLLSEAEPDDLLGLYEGVPLTERGAGYFGFLPDRITLFKRNIEREAGDPSGVKEVVRVTVIHEIAHHFGIDDDRLDELGWA